MRTDSVRSRTATVSLPPPTRLSLAQRRELDAELRLELAALDRRLASEAEDDVVAAADTYDAGSTHAGRRSSETLVRRDEIAYALARLASGDYGVCSNCGGPIPYGRLVVMPEATHCLGCSGHR